MKLSVLFSVASFLMLSACVNHEREAPQPLSECEQNPATFARDVNPIIQANCAISGCHITGSPDGDFTKYENLKEKVDNGTFKNSVIDGNTPVMPQTGKLADAQIRVLQCWLNTGALNN